MPKDIVKIEETGLGAGELSELSAPKTISNQDSSPASEGVGQSAYQHGRQLSSGVSAVWQAQFSQGVSDGLTEGVADADALFLSECQRVKSAFGG